MCGRASLAWHRITKIGACSKLVPEPLGLFDTALPVVVRGAFGYSSSPSGKRAPGTVTWAGPPHSLTTPAHGRMGEVSDRYYGHRPVSPHATSGSMAPWFGGYPYVQGGFPVAGGRFPPVASGPMHNIRIPGPLGPRSFVLGNEGQGDCQFASIAQAANDLCQRDHPAASAFWNHMTETLWFPESRKGRLRADDIRDLAYSMFRVKAPFLVRFLKEWQGDPEINEEARRVLSGQRVESLTEDQLQTLVEAFLRQDMWGDQITIHILERLLRLRIDVVVGGRLLARADVYPEGWVPFGIICLELNAQHYQAVGLLHVETTTAVAVTHSGPATGQLSEPSHAVSLGTTAVAVPGRADSAPAPSVVPSPLTIHGFHPPATALSSAVFPPPPVPSTSDTAVAPQLQPMPTPEHEKQESNGNPPPLLLTSELLDHHDDGDVASSKPQPVVAAPESPPIPPPAARHDECSNAHGEDGVAEGLPSTSVVCGDALVKEVKTSKGGEGMCTPPSKQTLARTLAWTLDSIPPELVALHHQGCVTAPEVWLRMPPGWTVPEHTLDLDGDIFVLHSRRVSEYCYGGEVNSVTTPNTQTPKTPRTPGSTCSPPRAKDAVESTGADGSPTTGSGDGTVIGHRPCSSTEQAVITDYWAKKGERVDAPTRKFPYKVEGDVPGAYYYHPSTPTTSSYDCSAQKGASDAAAASPLSSKPPQSSPVATMDQSQIQVSDGGLITLGPEYAKVPRLQCGFMTASCMVADDLVGGTPTLIVHVPNLYK